MNYKDRYRALPANVQLAIRDLMAVLLECDTEPIISTDGTVCQSEIEMAVSKIRSMMREVNEDQRRRRLRPAG